MVGLMFNSFWVESQVLLEEEPSRWPVLFAFLLSACAAEGTKGREREQSSHGAEREPVSSGGV